MRPAGIQSLLRRGSPVGAGPIPDQRFADVDLDYGAIVRTVKDLGDARVGHGAWEGHFGPELVDHRAGAGFGRGGVAGVGRQGDVDFGAGAGVRLAVILNGFGRRVASAQFSDDFGDRGVAEEPEIVLEIPTGDRDVAVGPP